MIVRHRIRVLIVDDSLVFREAVARGISKDPGIEVVGTAADPFMARDKIIELEPDVLTLDVEMPRMNGIEFLKRLMPQYPMPVVVVSAVNNSVFEALNAGAVDFVAKPDVGRPAGLETFINELIIKIKIASMAKTGCAKREHTFNNSAKNRASGKSRSLIAIGASTGGTEAIFNIIRFLPAGIPGIVIVQHMPPVFTRMYAERLDNSSVISVKEAENGDLILPGRALIAPGDFHMKVSKNGGELSVKCFKGDKVNGHCPSVDVLFNSVADVAGSSSIGIILTGMGYDGAKGLLNMKSKGAYAIGQDEQSSIVYGMPKVAHDIGAVDEQASLDVIPKLLLSLLNM